MKNNTSGAFLESYNKIMETKKPDAVVDSKLLANGAYEIKVDGEVEATGDPVVTSSAVYSGASSSPWSNKSKSSDKNDDGKTFGDGLFDENGLDLSLYTDDANPLFTSE